MKKIDDMSIREQNELMETVARAMTKLISRQDAVVVLIVGEHYIKNVNDAHDVLIYTQIRTPPMPEFLRGLACYLDSATMRSEFERPSRN